MCPAPWRETGCEQFSIVYSHIQVLSDILDTIISSLYIFQFLCPIGMFKFPVGWCVSECVSMRLCFSVPACECCMILFTYKLYEYVDVHFLSHTVCESCVCEQLVNV